MVHGQTKLVYWIRLEHRRGEEHRVLPRPAPAGQLDFEYLQDLPESHSEFIAPRLTTYQGSQSEDAGMLWLVRLANGSLTRTMPWRADSDDNSECPPAKRASRVKRRGTAFDKHSTFASWDHHMK